MALIELSQSGALTPGADAWIFPKDENIYWAKVINWYLNFQVVKAQQHEPGVLNAQLLKTIALCELDLPKAIMPMTEPLLIASASQLPNRWTAFIPHEKNHADWVRQAWTSIKNLNISSYRFFLPQDMSFAEFSNIWGNLEVDIESVSVVLDPKSIRPEANL